MSPPFGRTGFEAVLHDIAPGPAPPIRVVAKSAQGHPQVSRREDAVLVAETPGTAAVVRYRDDCRQLGREQTKGRQRSCQSVTASQGDNGGALLLLATGNALGRYKWQRARQDPPLLASQVAVGGGHGDTGGYCASAWKVPP